MNRVLILLIGITLLIGCTPTTPALVPATATASPAAPTAAPATPTRRPTHTPTTMPSPASASATLETPTAPASNTAQPTVTPSPTPRPTLGPGEWQQLPVIPAPGDRIIEIYRRGLEMGNNPGAFSKIGDCGSTPAWFLGDFDRGPEFYSLGDYAYLEDIIAAFHGSYGRTSLAARSGFNASSLFVNLWADRDYCDVNETPLSCEYRVQRPVIAFIMLGTNDIWRPTEFEPQMRKIIEYSIENGIIPILSTKADNVESNGIINDVIARLALEYDLPLWNFWLAVQTLPDKGLQEDQAHLTWGRNFFDDPMAMSKAWPVRNLTALQVLDAVWRKITTEN